MIFFFFNLVGGFSPSVLNHLSASLIQLCRRNSYWMFDVELCASLPRPCLVSLGSGEEPSRRDLTILDGWRVDLGYIQTITHKRVINRVKWSVVCQVDRREYIKNGLSQTHSLVNTKPCVTRGGFSEVAYSGEYCFNNTQWKKTAFRPKQKLPNLIRLRKVTLGQCVTFLLLCK